MAADTARLWDAWRASGDEAAFEKLVRPELPATYHLAQRLGLGRADAEDVVQDALLRLAQVRTDVPGRVGVGAWLMRTVRFQSLTRRRTDKRRRKHEQADIQRRRGGERRAFDVREEVEAALDQLEESDRQILMLRFLYDLDYREIAYVLGISENACRIRVHRASERMRARIGRKAPALLAAIPLPAFPKAAQSIAVATKGVASTVAGVGLLGGLIVSTGMKMAVSAAAAALLTAGAFMALREEPLEPSPDDPTDVSAITADPPAGQAASGAGAEPTLQTVPRDAGAPPVRGTGVIRGRVATKDGEGVGGIVVIATPMPASRGANPFEPPPRSSVEDEVREAAAAARRRASGRRRVTTSSDGAYKLDHLASGGYGVRAYGRGYEVRAARGQKTWDVKPGATVDFTAKAVVSLRVRVNGIVGEERVNVRRAMDLERLKRAGGYGWSEEHAVLRWEPGTWLIQATQGMRESEPQQVTLAPGAGETEVVLDLLDKPGLAGRIIFEDGAEGRRARVYAVPFEGRDPPATEGTQWMVTVRKALRGRHDPRTQRYSFKDIAPGQYLVAVTMSSYEVVASAVVEVRDRLVERDIEITGSANEGYSVFYVFGPDGKPLDAGRTQFQTSYKGGKHTVSGGGEALARKDGSWLVKHNSMTPTPGAHPDGVFRVRITHPEHGTRELEHDPTDEREITVRFERSSRLIVTLTGVDDETLQAAGNLYLKQTLDQTGLGLSTRSAERKGNVYTFDKVQPQAWKLCFYYSGQPLGGGPGMSLIQVAAQTVHVRDGDNRVDVSLPRLHTVRIVPADKEKRLRLGLRRLDGPEPFMHQFSEWDEKDGESLCRFVAPGRYELTGHYADKPYRREISVPQETVIRLE